jgi:hypothetical protein
MTPKEYLQIVLDQVDYERGACRPTEMVGAVLPREVLAKAREIAQAADEIADAVDRQSTIKFEIRNAIAGSAHITMLVAGLRSEFIVEAIYQALEEAGWLRAAAQRES